LVFGLWWPTVFFFAAGNAARQTTAFDWLTPELGGRGVEERRGLFPAA